MASGMLEPRVGGGFVIASSVAWKEQISMHVDTMSEPGRFWPPYNRFKSTLTQWPKIRFKAVLFCRTFSKFVHSVLIYLFSSRNEYLGINRWIFVREYSLLINCSISRCFSEKSRRCSIKQVCRGVKRKML